MIARSKEAIRTQVEAWIGELGTGAMMQSQSAIGGGSLPGESIPTCLLAIEVDSPNQFLKRLRQLDIPVIARIENERVVFDPRTVIEAQNSVFVSQIKSLVGQKGK